MKRSVWFGLFSLALILGTLVTVGCDDDEDVVGLPTEGSIGVYPSPNDPLFPWTLDGPDGYSATGEGDSLLTDMDVGDYTLTWGDMNGWVTPSENVEVGTLQGGRTLTFETTYRRPGTALPGQIQINPDPDDILPEGAPWILEVPDGDDVTGNGDQTFENQTPGDYTVIWLDVDGWETPDPMTLTLLEGEGIAFTAEYINLAASAFNFVEVPAGSFKMGSSRSEGGALPIEWPQHEVELTKDFMMSTTEVNWAQFERVMGYNPSYFLSIISEDIISSWKARPIDSVSWLEAIEFCNNLSIFEGYTPAYSIVGDMVRWNQDADGYRLPTEAEWEYACRAGTESALYNGLFTMQASSCYLEPNLIQIAWYCESAGGQPQDVATLDPNALGLYDMSGNLWEWVWDVQSNFDGFPVYLLDYDDGVTEYGEGNVTIVNPVDDFGDGRLLRLSKISMTFAFSSVAATPAGVSFRYLDFDGDVENFQVNGGDIYLGDLADAPAAIAPGVTFSVVTEAVNHEVYGDGVIGTVTLIGDVSSFKLGANLLWLDDIVIEDSASDVFALDRTIDMDLLSLNSVYRQDGDDIRSDMLLGASVVDPIGPAQFAGAPHVLRGGSYANEPRRCRSAARTEPEKVGRYAGFRLVRTLF